MIYITFPKQLPNLIPYLIGRNIFQSYFSSALQTYSFFKSLEIWNVELTFVARQVWTWVAKRSSDNSIYKTFSKLQHGQYTYRSKLCKNIQACFCHSHFQDIPGFHGQCHGCFGIIFQTGVTVVTICHRKLIVRKETKQKIQRLDLTAKKLSDL